MSEKFRQELMCEFLDKSEEYKIYLEAWLAYHRAANKIDGHIMLPRTQEEARLVHMAGRAGNSASEEVLRRCGISHRLLNKEEYQAAKLEALRIVENETK